MGDPRVGVIHEGRGDSEEEEETDSDGPILYTDDDDDDEDVPISRRHLKLSQTCSNLWIFILAVVACCRRAGEPRQEEGHAGHEAGAAGAAGAGG